MLHDDIWSYRSFLLPMVASSMLQILHACLLSETLLLL